MILEKIWDWNDDAIIYYNYMDVVHESYPFFYYLVKENNEIHYIKQISKHCAGVMDVNRYIEDEKPPVDYDVYQDTISWRTLGATAIDPPEELVEIIDGDNKTIFTYTPDGKLESRKEYSCGVLVYHVKIGYSKYKNRYFANHYINSKGVEACKLSNLWNYLSGKPQITKRHGK